MSSGSVSANLRYDVHDVAGSPSMRWRPSGPGPLLPLISSIVAPASSRARSNPATVPGVAAACATAGAAAAVEDDGGGFDAVPAFGAGAGVPAVPFGLPASGPGPD